MLLLEVGFCRIHSSCLITTPLESIEGSKKAMIEAHSFIGYSLGDFEMNMVELALKSPLIVKHDNREGQSLIPKQKFYLYKVFFPRKNDLFIR